MICAVNDRLTIVQQNGIETLHQHRAMLKQETGLSSLHWVLSIIMPRPDRVKALSYDARLTSVCLSHTLGLSREQRGLGRLKLAQR